MALANTCSEGRFKALIITAPGINCDLELGHAFELVGCTVISAHLSEVIRNPKIISQSDFIGMPGGFSYGDAIGAGRIVAHLIKKHLLNDFKDALNDFTPMIAPCNGFQVCLQAGLLGEIEDGCPLASLISNTSGKFIDSWSPLIFPKTNCVWTQFMSEETDGMYLLPIAHGEGRFVASKKEINYLKNNNLIPVKYLKDTNPNGSIEEVAGLCDDTGCLLGLMPHPERFLRWNSHPWSAKIGDESKNYTPLGLQFFESAMSFVRDKKIK